jgi:hypothetical protein
VTGARSRREVLKAGRRSLIVRLSPQRWPTLSANRQLAGGGEAKGANPSVARWWRRASSICRRYASGDSVIDEMVHLLRDPHTPLCQCCLRRSVPGN